MVGILPRGPATRQARILTERLVAKDFGFDLQTVHGADTATSFPDAKTKVVEAKLEMVRAARLLQYRSVVRRFCWLSRLDRI